MCSVGTEEAAGTEAQRRQHPGEHEKIKQELSLSYIFFYTNSLFLLLINNFNLHY